MFFNCLFLRDLIRFKFDENQQKLSKIELVYIQNLFTYKHFLVTYKVVGEH